MSNNLSFSMSLDDSDFSQKAQNAKQSLNEMGESVKKNNTFMREYMREIKNLKSQLLQLEEGTEEYTKAMQQLADKTFALRDIQETAKLSANDLGERFVLMSKTMGGVVGGINAVQGAMSLFGVESEAIGQTLVKLQSCIAIVQGLEGLEGLTKTIPACITMFKGLATQSKLCAVAMKSIPFVAIGSAIVGLIGYITKQTKATKELTEEQKKAEAEAKRLKKEEEYLAIAHTETHNEIGKLMGKYKLLQVQWQNLGNDMNAKKKFIKENEKAFNELGATVNDVITAEKILNQGTEEFCNNMVLRAKAVGLQNSITKLTEKYYEDVKNVKVEPKTVKAGDAVSAEMANRYGIPQWEYNASPDSYSNGDHHFYTQAEAKRVNEGEAQRAREEENQQIMDLTTSYNSTIESYKKELQDTNSKITQSSYDYNTPPTSNDKNTPQQINLLDVLKQSITDNNNYKAYNEEYVKQTGNELNSKNYWDDLSNNLQQLADASGNNEVVKQIETLIKQLPNYEAPKEKEEKEEKVEVNVLQLAQDAVNSGNFTVLDEYIKTQTQAQQGSVRFLEAKINTIQEVADNSASMEVITKVDTEVDKLKKELEKLKKEIREKTDPEGVQQEINQTTLNNANKTANNIRSATSSITSMMSSIAKCTDDATASWLNYFANIIGTAGQLISTIQAIATANAINSASQIPLIGWLSIGAAAASCIAAFASLPKFENGGIVGGNSYTGDKLLIRANSSEMVLSTIQQRNLFSLLNNGGTLHNNNGGVVHFKIQGKELVGVLSNYNNKVSKVI